MALVIHYKNGKLINSGLTYPKATPAPLYKSENKNTFVMGEVFDTSFEQVVNSDWVNNPSVLNNFDGAISIVKAEDAECVFATDLNGIESWYIYHKEDVFILSDNFWDIVKIVRPKQSDLDIDYIKTCTFMSANGDTVVDGLKVVFPTTIGRYDAKQNVLTLEKYSVFRYTSEIKDVEEAADRMDKILDQAMKNIKETCGDVKYGIGVSGGLDSRVIPHYAKKNGMDIVGFNVCVPKPHGFLLSQSCKNAKKIAKAFDMPYENTRWDAATVEEKIRLKVMHYPLGGGRNSFKFEPNMPKFDVLLTGGSGLIVGSMLPVKINDWSRDELVNFMSSFFNGVNNCRTFSSRAKRGLNYIFGLKLNADSKSNSFFSAEDICFIEKSNSIAAFVDKGLKIGQTNLEIYEDYFANVIGFRNRYGAYESILGQKRSFSIYVPFMLKETLKWDPKLLFDRVVLKRLIVKYIPEVKDVQSEQFEAAPGKKVVLWRKFCNMVEFLVRGNGAATDEFWMKKRSMKKKLQQRLNNSCTWFKSSFGEKANGIDNRVLKSKNCEFMINIWEFKVFIDTLETQEYLNFNFSNK